MLRSLCSIIRSLQSCGLSTASGMLAGMLLRSPPSLESTRDRRCCSAMQKPPRYCEVHASVPIIKLRSSLVYNLCWGAGKAAVP